MCVFKRRGGSPGVQNRPVQILTLGSVGLGVPLTVGNGLVGEFLAGWCLCRKHGGQATAMAVTATRAPGWKGATGSSYLGKIYSFLCQHRLAKGKGFCSGVLAWQLKPLRY